MRRLDAVGMILAALAGCLERDANHPPVLEPVSVATEEDRAKTFTIHAEDADGDPLELIMRSSNGGTYEVRLVSQAVVEGTNRLDVELRLDPHPDYHGQTSFPVVVTDGTERVSSTVPVTIISVNDAPTARDDAFATAAGTALVIHPSTVLMNDDDVRDLGASEGPANRGLAVAVVDAATHGVVTLEADAIRFVPEPGYVGTAQFRYAISDGADTAGATVRVWVGGPNTAPTAAGDEAVTMEEMPLELEQAVLLRNDVDDDGHTIALSSVDNAQHGTVAIEAGIVRFTPERGYFGPGGFDYTITDGAATSSARVAVEIAPYL